MSTIPTPTRPSRARLFGLVAAAGVTLVLSLGALTTAGLLLWADGEADDDGFLNTRTEQIATDGFAVTTGHVDLDLDGVGSVLDEIGSGDVKVSADAGGAAGTFVGIAPTADVERYLRGAGRAVITDFEGWPADPEYHERPGDRRPERPGAQDFWVAEVAGDGRQVLTWDVRDGDWTAVVMHADASRGLDASVSGGVELPPVAAVGFAALGTGLLLLAGSGVLLWLAVRRPRVAGDGSFPGGGRAPAGSAPGPA